MQWVSILGNISIWIILLPLFLGLGGYGKLNRESRIIFFVVLIGTIQVMKPFIDNSCTYNVLSNLYTPAEFILYFFMFLSKTSSSFNRKFLYGSLLFFSVISIVFVYKQGLCKEFLNVWVIINNTIQICWVCLCLMEYFNNDESVIEIYHPFFWFLSGITAYATCTIAVYSLWYFIKSDSKGPAEFINVIHHIFNILLYVFFSIGILMNYRHKNRH